MAISNKDSIIFDYWTCSILASSTDSRSRPKSLEACRRGIQDCRFVDGFVLNNAILKSDLFKELYDIKN